MTTYPETVNLSPNRHKGRLKPIRLIVLHDGETPEHAGVAEAMGGWFAQPRAKSSAHMSVDNNSRVRSVNDADTAWAAPGANADGLQLEQAGRASQTAGQWADEYSTATLDNAAQVVADWCRKYQIPARYLTNAQLGDGISPGITYHWQCTQVFGGTHTDPGPNYPFGGFLAHLKANYLDLPKPPPAPVVPAKLDVDGIAGPLTFARARSLCRASADRWLIQYLQTRLNAAGFRGMDGKPLVVDGRGIYSNALRKTPPTHTTFALLCALGNKSNDGTFDALRSPGVVRWQEALNAGRLW